MALGFLLKGRASEETKKKSFLNLKAKLMKRLKKLAKFESQQKKELRNLYALSIEGDASTLALLTKVRPCSPA